MQMNFRSMVYPQPSDVFPQPYMKSSELLFENGLPHIGYVAPAIKSPSIHGAVSAVAHPWTTAKLPKEPQQLGWVGSVHNFGCAFNSESIPLKTTYDVKTSCHEYKLPAANPKHFLVFDQSGDKTTLVYSSEINRTQFHFNFSTNSKLPSPLPIEDHSHNSNKRKSEICNEEAPFCWSPELTTYKVNDDDDGDDTGGCIRSDSGSEMREDTEEINALLYSDDDELESSEDDDDEVTSTGHSPPSDELLDDYKGNENFAGWYEDGHAIAEQVASSFSYPTKRLKTSHGTCDVVGLSLMENSPTTMLDTSRPSSDNEDDAESGCGDFNSVDYDDVDFLDAVVSCGGSKEGWLKEERIREALGILKLLSDARYISQTMKVGALGVPPYRTFSLEEIEEATSNFNTSAFMGEGSHGQMYKGQLRDGSFVAIKCLKLKHSRTSQYFMKHIELISKLRHRHLVSAIGHCFEYYLDDSTISRFFLIFEYVPNGNLRRWASGRSRKKLKWTQRIEAAIGVAWGVQFLHAGVVPGILSNNLKITDILMDRSFVAKISSYNLPLLSENIEEVPANTCSASKEVKSRYEDKQDIYAIGVILLELIMGVQIKSSTEVHALKNQVQASIAVADKSRRGMVVHEVGTTCSDQSLKTVMELCVRCLAEHPWERPSIEDVIWNLQFASQVQEAWQLGDFQSSSGSSSSMGSPVSPPHPPRFRLTYQ